MNDKNTYEISSDVTLASQLLLSFVFLLSLPPLLLSKFFIQDKTALLNIFNVLFDLCHCK